MSSAIRRLRRVAELSPGEVLTLLAAAAALRVVRLPLSVAGLQRTQHALAARTPLRRRPDDAAAAAAATARLIAVASRFGPAKPNCLQRSLVLWWLLRRRGLDSEIRIGVRRSRVSDGLDFHAWLEHDGTVVNDARDIRDQFATFDRAIVPRSATFD